MRAWLLRALKWGAAGLGLLLVGAFCALFLFLFETEERFWDAFEAPRAGGERVKLAEMSEVLRRGVVKVESEGGDCNCSALLRRLFRADGSRFCGLEWQVVRAVNSGATGGGLARHAAGVVGICTLASRFSREEILEEYLNRAYFGHDQYGVASAARFFYKKKPADLSLEESAGLIAVIRAPAYFSPIDHRERFLQRRAYVMRALAE